MDALVKEFSDLKEDVRRLITEMGELNSNIEELRELNANLERLNDNLSDFLGGLEELEE